MTSIKDGRGTQKNREDRSNVRELHPGRGSSSSAGSRPVAKIDPDACPAGYDPEVWSLTLLFRQCASAERIDLYERSNLLAYAKLERTVIPFREWFSRRPEKARPVFIPDGPVPAFRVAQAWTDVIEAAIRYRFGAYVEDQYALDRFCQDGLFRDMVREMRERGRNRYLVSRAAELPDREPGVMIRKVSLGRRLQPGEQRPKRVVAEEK